MMQDVSKISAEVGGVFFVRTMTDASVMVRTAIEISRFKGISGPCDASFNIEIN